MSYLIGIDIGTTGTKTILVDEKGNQLASALEEYPLYTPHPKWAEQEPEDWWKATVNTIREVIEKSEINNADIKGIGLSGQMHGLVIMDKKHQVLRPSILWCDVRTSNQCRYIRETVGTKILTQSTCNPVLEGFTAPKIIWVRDQEPEIYEQTTNILLPKDYVRFRLTGEISMEVSDAAGTLLFDVAERQWSQAVLDKLDLNSDLLPPTYESIDVCGKITPSVAEITGLLAGTPVVGGGADNACSAVGNGIVKEGRVSASLGTSGVVLAHSDQVRVDPDLRLHSFCHSVPNKCYIMGVMLSAGGAYRWFRDTVAQRELAEAKANGTDAYNLLGAQAETAPVGSEGLIFLPYLTGERTPHADANAKANFFGLTLRHQRSHLIRSVMEGVTYGMRDSLELIRGLGTTVDQIYATGGGSRSTLWRQMQADIYQAEIVTINIEEGPAFGAAILAGVGTGVYTSVESATDQIVKITSQTDPISDHVEIYEQYYRIYRDLYPVLKPKFDQVTEVIEQYNSD